MRKISLLLVLTVLSTVILNVSIFPVVNATEVTLPAVADTYTERYTTTTQTTNYGTSALLDVRNQTTKSDETYIRFDLTGIDTSRITSAKLKLYHFSTALATAIPVGVYKVDNDTWSETAITWNSPSPAVTGALISTTTIPTGSTGIYREWDITSYATNHADSLISVKLAGTSVITGNLGFNSKETITGNPPQLVITYADVPSAIAGDITGTGAVGDSLTAGYTFVPNATTGALEGATTFQWKSCSTSNGTYANIADATSSTLTVTRDLMGKYVKCAVTPVDTTAAAGDAATTTAFEIIAPVSTVSVKYADNSDVTNLIDGGTITASATVDGAAGTTASVIAVIYDVDNSIYDIQYTSLSFASDGPLTCDNLVSQLPADVTGYKYKLFVLDSFGTLKPITLSSGLTYLTTGITE